MKTKKFKHTVFNRTISFKDKSEQTTLTEFSRFAKNSQKSVLQTVNPRKLSVRPTVQAIEKAVKNNDISYLIGEKKVKKLRTQPVDDRDWTLEAAKHHLFNERKKLDQLKYYRQLQDKKINKLKTEASTFEEKRRSLSLRQKSFEIDKKIGQKVESKKYELEEKVIEKKVLLHMKQRLISDNIYHKKKQYEAIHSLEKTSQRIKQLKAEKNEISLKSTNAAEVLKKLIQQIDEQNFERIEHLNNVQYMLEKQSKVVQEEAFRETNAISIANETLQKKLDYEKQWNKVHLTHVFVQEFLKNKMTLEMKKFNTVQLAFIHIKNCTGINSGKELVEKFLNKQAIYGELLSKVSQKTVHMEELKREKASLIMELQALELQKENFQKKHRQLPKGALEKEMEKWLQRSKNVKFQEIKFREWLKKQMEKLGIKIDKNGPIKENFIKYLAEVEENLERLEPLKEEWMHTVEKKNSRDQERPRRQSMYQKNIREELAKGNSFTLENQEINNKEEIQQLNVQRDQMLKKNEKFMKEAKKRKLQTTKEQLERQQHLEKNKKEK